MSGSRALWVCLAGVAGAVVAGGCSSSARSSATTTTTVPVGTISPGSSAASTTTTTVALPPAPQATAEAAAGALVLGWENRDRPYAASVATTAAVNTLFATPYSGQTMVNRGCTTDFPPYVCSYGPAGGGSGALYQINLAQAAGRWYVTSVTVEG